MSEALMMTPRCVAAYFSAVSIRADWEQRVDRRCLSGNWGREIRLVPTPFSTKRVDEVVHQQRRLHRQKGSFVLRLS